MNIVCIGVIWISGTFNYYLISRNLEAQKIDLFYSTIISSSSDIVGFIMGYYLFVQMGIHKSLFRGFIIAVFGVAFMLSFQYVYQGSELVTILFFSVICKVGCAIALMLGFFVVVVVFKPRIHGTAFGICFAVAYVMTLFAPVITNSNPAWVPLAFLALFGLFGAVISLVIKHE